MPSSHPATNGHGHGHGHSDLQAQAGPSDLTKAPHSSVEPLPTFRQTSQYQHWIYSASRLQELREDEWAASRARLHRQWGREAQLAATTTGDASALPVAPEVWPDVQQLNAMVRFYLGKLRGLVGVFGLPDLVEETASTYLKRFFVRRCAMEWSVKDVMLTCLYLSLKSTSHTMPLSYFASKIAGKTPVKGAAKEMEETIRGLEFGVADAIGWELSVHGPGRALRGLVYDMQTLQPSPLSTLHALLPRAQALLWAARLTDLELLYPPSQIALACVLGSAASSSGSNALSHSEPVEDDASKLVRRWLDEKYARAEAEYDRRRKEQEQIKAQSGDAEQTSSSAGGTKITPEAARPFEMTLEELQGTLRAIVDIIRAQEALSRQSAKTVEEGQEGYVANGKAPTRELVEVKKIDALLKACADPEKRPGSASHAQAKRAQARPSLSSTERSKKASQLQQPNGLSDPFASPEDERNAKRIKMESEQAGLGDAFDRQSARREQIASEWDSDDDVPTSRDALRKTEPQV